MCGCQGEQMPAVSSADGVGVFGDMMRLKFHVTAPDHMVVGTRAAHPEGKGIQKIDVICFDAQGMYLGAAQGTIVNTDAVNGESGQVSVEVSHKTRIMHIVGNLPDFDADSFKGLSELEVFEEKLSEQESMVYWARVQVPGNVEELYTEVPDAAKRKVADAVLDWITIETNPKTTVHKGVAGKGNPIVLLRNQAKITLESVSTKDGDEWEGDYFVITGYILNHNFLSGTVAPLEPQYRRYPSYGSEDYGISQWLNQDFIHISQNSVSVELNDEMVQNLEVLTDREQFIFESANTIQVPLDIIVKGYNVIGDKKQDEKYYKVNLVDKDFQLISVRRNYHYKVSIEGNLFYGVQTLEEAILPTTPATNNVWIYIADEVTSVMSSDYKLTVEDYLVVVDSEQLADDSKLSLTFTVEDVNGDGVSDLDRFTPEVSWYVPDTSAGEISGMGALNWYNGYAGEGAVNVSSGEGAVKVSSTTNLNAVIVRESDVKMVGTITVDINTPAEDEDLLAGTILVKYSHLQRKINIVSMKIQSFGDIRMEVLPKADDAPATNYRERVQLSFNVPDSYPEGLYPFNVLISTNAFSMIPLEGQKVSIVTNMEEGYGETFKEIIDGKEISDSGYKYAVSVTGPGEQIVLLQSIYTEKDQSDEVQFVSLEADHFYRSNVLFEE